MARTMHKLRKGLEQIREEQRYHLAVLLMQRRREAPRSEHLHVFTAENNVILLRCHIQESQISILPAEKAERQPT